MVEQRRADPRAAGCALARRRAAAPGAGAPQLLGERQARSSAAKALALVAAARLRSRRWGRGYPEPCPLFTGSVAAGSGRAEMRLLRGPQPVRGQHRAAGCGPGVCGADTGHGERAVRAAPGEAASPLQPLRKRWVKGRVNLGLEHPRSSD